LAEDCFLVLGIAKLKAEAEMRQVNDNMKPRRLKNELVLLRTLPNGVLRTLPNGGAGILPAFPRGCRRPFRHKGRFAIVTHVECGMRWMLWRQKTNGARAGGEVVWP
jgi:hypothetical protein